MIIISSLPLKNKYKIYKRYNTICLFSLILLISCENSGHKYYSIGEFPVKKMLIAERILPERIFAPDFFVIQSGHLCIYSTKKDTMIDMFSLPDLSFVKSFGVKGMGPDEFKSFAAPCVATNQYVYVRGYTPVTIKQILIDDNFHIEVKNSIDCLCTKCLPGHCILYKIH